MANEINRMDREIKASAEKKEIDWATLEAENADDPDFLAMLKQIAAAEAEMFAKASADLLAEQPKLEKEISDHFNKEGGLLSVSAEIEAAAKKEMEDVIHKLEVLEDQMKVAPPHPPPCARAVAHACIATWQTIDDVTVAEMLEKDPEMRKEIEEEIKNHNWAP